MKFVLCMQVTDGQMPHLGDLDCSFFFFFMAVNFIETGIQHIYTVIYWLKNLSLQIGFANRSHFSYFICGLDICHVSK